MNVMRETLLQEVRRTEEKARENRAGDLWNMRFHIMPPIGWLNDPNGLCFYRGKYYFFFQYAPFDAQGGLKLWGEYSSRDLIHWQYEGTPLLPDSPYDCHGVYSGSAFVEDGEMELFYTGNIKLDGDYDYTNSGREAYTITTSSVDGIHFGDKKCLLTMEDYPGDYTTHIRDPKVWKRDGFYYMILGGRKKSDKGSVLLYQSQDKKSWRFFRELTTEASFGYMWECPDMFRLDGQWILSVSPQGLKEEEYSFQNVYQSGYFLISDIWIEEDCKIEQFIEWDMGFDFYAPQTFLDGNGRRILVAWAGMADCGEDYHNPTVAEGWQHVFSTPRELTLIGDKVYQYPVEEINMLRQEKVGMKAREQKDNMHKPYTIQATLYDSCFDWEITDIGSENCRISIERECILQYENNVFSLKFTGKLGAGRKERKAKVKTLSSIRILADTSLLEIYLNEGEYVFTTRYYPQHHTRELAYEGKTGHNTLWSINRQTCLTGI